MIYKIIAEFGGHKGAGSAPVPVRRGPQPQPPSTQTNPKPIIEREGEEGTD